MPDGLGSKREGRAVQVGMTLRISGCAGKRSPLCASNATEPDVAGEPLADGIRLVRRNLVVERHVRLARETLREQAEPLQEPIKR